MGISEDSCRSKKGAEVKKINYGCGKRVLTGFINIDAVVNPGAPRPPEVLHELTFDASGALQHKTPLPDDCADELLSVHFLEHLYSWQSAAVIQEWRRLLKPGGLLVLELPNLVKCAKNLLALKSAGGRPLQQMAMWGIYGDDTLRDPYMCHRSGWWPEALIEFLTAHGFSDAREGVPVWHKAGIDNRDMRITAFKA